MKLEPGDLELICRAVMAEMPEAGDDARITAVTERVLAWRGGRSHVLAEETWRPWERLKRELLFGDEARRHELLDIVRSALGLRDG